MVWIFVSSWNSDVEILTSKVMVLIGGPLGGDLDIGVESSWMVIALTKYAWESFFTPFDLWSYRKKRQWAINEEGCSPDTKSACTILDFPAPTAVKKEISLFLTHL